MERRGPPGPEEGTEGREGTRKDAGRRMAARGRTHWSISVTLAGGSYGGHAVLSSATHIQGGGDARRDEKRAVVLSRCPPQNMVKREEIYADFYSASSPSATRATRDYPRRSRRLPAIHPVRPSYQFGLRRRGVEAVETAATGLRPPSPPAWTPQIWYQASPRPPRGTLAKRHARRPGERVPPAVMMATAVEPRRNGWRASRWRLPLWRAIGLAHPPGRAPGSSSTLRGRGRSQRR